MIATAGGAEPDEHVSTLTCPWTKEWKLRTDGDYNTQHDKKAFEWTLKKSNTSSDLLDLNRADENV